MKHFRQHRMWCQYFVGLLNICFMYYLAFLLLSLRCMFPTRTVQLCFDKKLFSAFSLSPMSYPVKLDLAFLADFQFNIHWSKVIQALQQKICFIGKPQSWGLPIVLMLVVYSWFQFISLQIILLNLQRYGCIVLLYRVFLYL